MPTDLAERLVDKATNEARQLFNAQYMPPSASTEFVEKLERQQQRINNKLRKQIDQAYKQRSSHQLVYTSCAFYLSPADHIIAMIDLLFPRIRTVLLLILLPFACGYNIDPSIVLWRPGQTMEEGISRIFSALQEDPSEHDICRLGSARAMID
ncbi:potential membrane protein [Pseudozyma hubeiensis SY62]|uniref:Potential membrane protein n=1 Tax=Pseudozyma hubeiensis (strain SY62) TaxID=1305764 RepID=R9P7W2_PSEHS|nr:potential membrane protein [Pseudozyma hubeiensis SY62]GAC97419.1 potential membrane protein [Pseudozyma hubeiensis SY62]